VTSSIIRKKILNWLTVGIKEYSLYLRSAANGKMEAEQITYSEIPFNVFMKCNLRGGKKNNQNNFLPTLPPYTDKQFKK
jgi:hypothetical protein